MGRVIAGYWLLSLMLLMADSLKIKVLGLITQAGGDIRITCHVPRDPDNRGLEVGVEGYRSSFFDMEGADAPITFEVWVKRMPCGASSAYCFLKSNGAKVDQFVRQRLLVVGCEDGQ